VSQPTTLPVSGAAPAPGLIWARLVLALLRGLPGLIAVPVPATAAPAPPEPAARYTLAAEVDFTRAVVTAAQRLDWRNLTDTPLTELVFHVTLAHYGAFRLGDCRVDGAACEPRLDATVLEVPLMAPLPPGQSVQVELGFQLEVPQPGNLRFGKAQGILALGHWFPALAVYRDARLAGLVGAGGPSGRAPGWDRHPYTDVGDPFFAEAADYDVTIRTDVPLTIAATGQRVEQEGTTTRYVGRSLRDFALALSDRYQTVSAEVGGTTITVYTRPGHAAGADTALRAAAETVRFLSRTVAPYPWGELHVAETSNPGGNWDGQEFSGLMFISSHHLARPGPPGSYLWYLVAHEVVHQWFYAAVGNDQLYEPWLDEAPATQLAWLTLREVAPAAYSASWQQLQARWQAARAAYGDRPVDAGVYDFRPAAADAYYAVVYRRGALFLDDVRRQLGDDAYFALLRDYYAAHVFGIATTPDLHALITARLGDGGQALIARYFN